MLGSMPYFGFQIPIRITGIVLQSFLREQYKKKTLISQASRNVSFQKKGQLPPPLLMHKCPRAHSSVPQGYGKA